jgi:hypothetical protein
MFRHVAQNVDPPELPSTYLELRSISDGVADTVPLSRSTHEVVRSISTMFITIRRVSRGFNLTFTSGSGVPALGRIYLCILCHCRLSCQRRLY